MCKEVVEKEKEQIGVIVRAGIIRVKRKKVEKVDMVAKSA